MSGFRKRPCDKDAENPVFSQRWTNGRFDSCREGDQIDFYVGPTVGGYACDEEPAVCWDVSKHEGNDIGVGSSANKMPVPVARSFAEAILAACRKAEGS